MNTYYAKRHPIKPVDYEEAYWGEIVDPDGNTRNRLEEQQKHLDDVKQELEFLNSLIPGHILDVGCGLGYLLSGLVGNWDKYGVEVSRFAAGHAQQWGRIHVGDIQSAGYPDEYFDVVVIHHVIEHLEDPEKTIIEISRVLKPAGILVLATPDFDSGCARRFGKNYRLLHDDTHISLFTNESMHRFLLDFGFVIDRVEYPFFETRHFTHGNLERLFDVSKVSPPFYGNFMTFYCHKPKRTDFYAAMLELSRLAITSGNCLESQVEQASQLLVEVINKGGKALACGNGGSAADAQHFVGELIGHLLLERRSLPAIALTSDPSVVTALGNDYGFEHVFSRQIEGLGEARDILVVISTSGVSRNIVKAVQVARERGLRTIALVGNSCDPVITSCDVCIEVPSNNTQRIQEIHTAILHSICEYLEQHIINQVTAK